MSLPIGCDAVVTPLPIDVPAAMALAFVMVAAVSEPIVTVALKFTRLSVDRSSVAVADTSEPGATLPVAEEGEVAIRLAQERVPAPGVSLSGEPTA